MERKILIVVTCHRLLDIMTEIVRKFIDESNNSVHLTMKSCKKIVEILND